MTLHFNVKVEYDYFEIERSELRDALEASWLQTIKQAVEAKRVPGIKVDVQIERPTVAGSKTRDPVGGKTKSAKPKTGDSRSRKKSP